MERRFCRPGSFTGKESFEFIVDVAGAASSVPEVVGVPSTRNRTWVTRRIDLKTRQSDT
jgi:hypothetical protein